MPSGNTRTTRKDKMRSQNRMASYLRGQQNRRQPVPHVEREWRSGPVALSEQVETGDGHGQDYKLPATEQQELLTTALRKGFAHLINSFYKSQWEEASGGSKTINRFHCSSYTERRNVESGRGHQRDEMDTGTRRSQKLWPDSENGSTTHQNHTLQWLLLKVEKKNNNGRQKDSSFYFFLINEDQKAATCVLFSCTSTCLQSQPPVLISPTIEKRTCLTNQLLVKI